LSLGSFSNRRVGYYIIWQPGASGASSNGSHNTCGGQIQYQTSLMKTMKDGPLSLDGCLRSKGIFNHPYSIEQRGNAERRTLDALRERKDSNRKHEVQPVDLLEQEPLIPVVTPPTLNYLIMLM